MKTDRHGDSADWHKLAASDKDAGKKDVANGGERQKIERSGGIVLNPLNGFGAAFVGGRLGSK